MRVAVIPASRRSSCVAAWGLIWTLGACHDAAPPPMLQMTPLADAAMATHCSSSFTRRSALVGGGAVVLATNDMDGDGWFDLVTINSTSDSASVLLQQAGGGGEFREQKTVKLNAGPVGPGAVAILDYDGDRKYDLGVAGGIWANMILVLHGDGMGGFDGVTRYDQYEKPSHDPQGTYGPFGAIAGDFNLDGAPDLAFGLKEADRVAVALNDRVGGFVMPMLLSPARNAQTGAYHDVLALAAGDFDRDGKPDIAVTAYNDFRVIVLRGDGTGRFTPFPGANAYAVGNDPAQVLAVDTDGDPFLDLVVANTTAMTDAISLLRGRGDGSFEPATNLPLAATPRSVLVEDIDDDGLRDIAVSSTTTNDVRLFLGLGGGRFGAVPATILPIGGSPGVVVGRDLNRDGCMDLAVTDATNNKVVVYYNIRE